MNKQMVALTIATALMATTALAQSAYFSSPERHHSANLDKAAQQYARCLESCNTGVVESALAHVVLMKLYVPEKEFDGVREKIGSLSVNGCNPTIRYKAYLASLVYDDPELFAQERGQSFSDPEALFNSVSNRLQVTLLGSHDRKYVRPE